LSSGIKYEIITSGNGPIAAAGQKVKVKYEGRLTNTSRQKFDSGILEFRLGSGEMIQGFDLGVRGMLVNEYRRICIPARLGYGKQRVGIIPPNSDITFTVKLLGISKK